MSQRHRRSSVQLVSSQTAFAGRLIRVRIDRVELPSGRVAAREVVEHPGAVGVLPLDAEGRVWLVRQYRHPAGKTLLELPAGLREPGESSTECARRELAEEIGLHAGRLRRLLGYYPSAGFCTEFIDLFLATDLSPARTREAAEEEIVEVVRLHLAEALSLTRQGEIRDAKTIIALLLLGSTVGWGLDLLSPG